MVKYSFHYSERNKKIHRVVHKVRRFRLNHKNIIFMLISFLVTYLLLKSGALYFVVSYLGGFGYFSAFVLGVLFSFGFTTVPAAAGLYFLADQMNPFFMTIIAATGAMMGNFFIYSFVKYSFIDELRYILSNDLRLDFYNFEIAITKRRLKSRSFKYIVPAISGILTALPIPTEMFVSILWNISKLETRNVLLLSYVFSFVGILALGLL